MKAWGHDTSALENADDIAAREASARLKAERDSWWAADGTGGYPKPTVLTQGHAAPLRHPSITQRGRFTEVEPEPLNVNKASRATSCTRARTSAGGCARSGSVGQPDDHAAVDV